MKRPKFTIDPDSPFGRYHAQMERRRRFTLAAILAPILLGALTVLLHQCDEPAKVSAPSCSVPGGEHSALCDTSEK